MQVETVRVANMIRIVPARVSIGIESRIGLRRQGLAVMMQAETARAGTTTRTAPAGILIGMQGLIVPLHPVRIATMQVEIVRRVGTMTVRIGRVGRMIRIVLARVSIGIESRIGLRRRGLAVMMQAETVRAGIPTRIAPAGTSIGMQDLIVPLRLVRIATMQAEIARRAGTTIRTVLVLKREVAPNGPLRRRVRKRSL